MTDTYENKQAWTKAVKGAYRNGVLDRKDSCIHVEAVTSGEKSAMKEMKQAITAVSFSVPAMPWLEKAKETK